MAGVLAVPQAVLLARYVAAVVLPSAERAPACAVSALLVIVSARAILGWLAESDALSRTASAKARIRAALATRLVAAGPARLAHERTGELTHTLSAAIDHLDAYNGAYRLQRAAAVVVPIAAFGVTAVIDPLSALVLAITGPLIPLFMVLLGGAARERSERQWTQLARLGARFLDALQATPTMAAFGQRAAEAERLRIVSDTLRLRTMEVLRVAFVSALTLEWLATLGTAIVAVEVGLRLLYGHLSLAPALTVLLLAPEFYRPLRALGGAFHAGLAGREVTRRIDAIAHDFPAPPDVDDSPARGARSRALRSRTSRCSAPRPIARRSRPCRWKSRPVSSSRSWARPAPARARCCRCSSDSRNQRAVWSGLTTSPLTDVDTARWRAGLAWVAQRPHLFHGTLRSNLALGCPDADDVSMLDAARRSSLLSVASAGVAALDAPLGEGGAGLSGGEIQRLAIARAFLRQAPLLLLDEPTSELDPETEHRVLQSIAAMTTTTRIMVTHRLSAASHADRVIVIERGRVIECGPPSRLARAGGTFAGLMARTEAV